MSSDSVTPSQPTTPEQAAQVASQSVPESGGLPQLDVNSYPSQLFWLAITFVLLYLLVSKSALPRIQRVVDHRKNRIEEDLDRADVMTQQADSARAAYEKIAADGRAASNRLIDEHLHANHQRATDTLSALDQTLHSELARAQAALDTQRATLEREIGPVAEKASAQIVEKLLGRAPANGQRRKAAS